MTVTSEERGELLYLPDIMKLTKMPEASIRTRYHSGTMPCLWKLGRRLVAWENDLYRWMAEQQEATAKTRANTDGGGDLSEEDCRAKLEEARKDWAELRVKLMNALGIDHDTRPLPSVAAMVDTLIYAAKGSGDPSMTPGLDT